MTAKPKYWKFFCEEHTYPGLWHTWFKNQVVAVGWCAEWGFKLKRGISDRGWSRARNCLEVIEPGDWVVVQLMHNRVGRIGQVTEKRVGDDQWDPTVLPVPPGRSRLEKNGENGRRILVRWDLGLGSLDPDWVTHLPESARFSSGKVRAALCELSKGEFERVRAAMRNERNWVNIVPGFEREAALSDFIAQNPHRVADGLRAFPAKIAREKVFRDGTRADVLLLDRSDNVVLVECKQGSAEPAHVKQLRRYMKLARAWRRTGNVRGILVHGGPRRVSRDVLVEARKRPEIELYRYTLDLDFAPSA